MKKCGIIGGVGPSATVQLMQLIIKHTHSTRDQDHLRMIIDNHPQIPDRTQAILYGGESPEKHLAESIRILKGAGVDFIACPCNTAHFFLRNMKKKHNFILIDMVEETVRYLINNNYKTAGLLSTSGTASSGIYQATCREKKVKIINPDQKGIDNVMEAVYGKYGIKANARYEKSRRNKNLLMAVVKQFEEADMDAVIMGCSEIPLCLTQKDTPVPLINPNEILAKAIIEASEK